MKLDSLVCGLKNDTVSAGEEHVSGPHQDTNPGAEENHGKLQSGQLIPRPIFEPGTPEEEPQ
jgi:hypothetical protein